MINNTQISVTTILDLLREFSYSTDDQKWDFINVIQRFLRCHGLYFWGIIELSQLIDFIENKGVKVPGSLNVPTEFREFEHFLKNIKIKLFVIIDQEVDLEKFKKINTL